jgi:ribosomal-protein-alanine N-acetyltransferase
MSRRKHAALKNEMQLFISTDRLLIMHPSKAAFDSIHKISRKNIVMKFIGDGALNTKAKTRFKIKEAVDHFNQFGYSFGPVYEKMTMKFVGQAGIFHLRHDDTQDKHEIGYRLHPSAFGKGYATEIAKGLVAWAFTQANPFHAVYAMTEPENIASQKVLTHAGLTLESEDEKSKNFRIDRKSFQHTFYKAASKLNKQVSVETEISDSEMANSSFGMRRPHHT